MNTSQRDQHNMNNSDNGNSASILINVTGASGGDVISYQRVKKTISRSTYQDQIDEEIKVREDYLNRMKSIDLEKYSFPNELVLFIYLIKKLNKLNFFILKILLIAFKKNF